MKKISVVLVALLAAVTMRANVVTFDFTNPSSLNPTVIPSATTSNGVQLSGTTFTAGDISLAFPTATGSGFKEWTNANGSYELHFYKTNSMTISSSADNITMIEFFFTDRGGLVADSGEINVVNIWLGDAQSVMFQNAGTTSEIKSIVVTYGEPASPWVPDTISVTEARARIDSGNSTQCYVYGVVATAPSDPGSFKNTIFWLTDIDNPTDSLEGYKIAGLNGADILTIDDIPFGLGDTVMIFANTLSLYRNDVYEINGGYYVETLGKATIINATSLFPFAYGAIVGEADDAEERYHFDVVLTSEYGNPNKGIHMGIVSKHKDGIEGTYTLYPDNSFVNGDTEGETLPISGSVEISYVEAGSVYNKYDIAAIYSMNDHIYRIDTVYEIPAITGEYRINLVGDTPFIPNEGDTITCAQALRYAKTLEPGMIGVVNVYIHGWITSIPKRMNSKTYQCWFYMDDVPEGTKNSPAQSYYCYEQGLDSLCVGDEVLLYGKVQMYNGTAEIVNGNVIRLNDGAKHYRDIQCIDMTTSYISVDRAYEIGMALDVAPGETVESEVEYTVAGYIAKVDYQTKNDTATWFMTDDKTSTYGNLLAYKCYIPALIAPEDAVMITGKILKYVKNNGTNISIEFRAATAAFLCHLEKNYTISTAVNDDQRGMVQGSKLASYLEEITLTAVANDGYHFTQWNDGNTENPRTIIVTQDSAFTAMFANDFINNVITYTATEQLRGYDGSLNVGATTFGPAITSHEFVNGTGTITCSGEITTIGDYAFCECTSLTSVTIPNSVTTIEGAAFYGCTGLTSITIPNSVTTIGVAAFEDCSGLTKTNYTGTIADWCKIQFGNPSANPMYYSYNFYINDVEIKDLVIPEGVDTIENSAFVGCIGLTSITIPYSVTTIGNDVFFGCSGLIKTNYTGTIADWCKIKFGTTYANPMYRSHNFYINDVEIKDLVIPEGVDTIENFAFSHCSGLTSVTIPNSVIAIGKYAFSHCSGLTSITSYVTNPPTCGKNCFYNVNKSIPVYVPTLSVDAYQQAEEWKEFTNILPIGAEEVPFTNPIITPNNHSVTITWPQTDNADTYTLEIRQNGELVCTLTFDNQGVMTNIAFAAPSRGGVRTSSNAEMTGNGYRFTVMGLETGTDYTYAVTAKDASQQTLKTYSGEFTTTGSISTGINGLTIDNGASAHSDKCTVRKFIRNNQLQIMRNDKLFNALGGRIR